MIHSLPGEDETALRDRLVSTKRNGVSHGEEMRERAFWSVKDLVGSWLYRLMMGGRGVVGDGRGIVDRICGGDLCFYFMLVCYIE